MPAHVQSARAARAACVLRAWRRHPHHVARMSGKPLHMTIFEKSASYEFWIFTFFLYFCELTIRTRIYT